jgi:hypothetical protein
VDNGAIRFSHVRVPRTNLLDRFASVDKSGRYSSPLTSEVRCHIPILTSTLPKVTWQWSCDSKGWARVEALTYVMYKGRSRQACYCSDGVFYCGAWGQ